MGMKQLILAAGLCALAAPALGQETPLPVPDGYTLIQESTEAYYINVASLRSNMVGGAKSTSGIVLSFAAKPDGTPIYALSDFVARCQSKQLERHRIRYVTGDEKVIGGDDNFIGGNVEEGSNSYAIYTRLCADWDKDD